MKKMNGEEMQTAKTLTQMREKECRKDEPNEDLDTTEGKRSIEVTT